MQRSFVGSALVACAVSCSAFADEGYCKNAVWTTVDDYVVANKHASASAVLVKGSTAYVAGIADDTVTQRWTVRKTTNGGQTWSVVDDYLYSIGLRNHPEAIVADGRGNIFVAGGANNLSMEGKWIVRRSSNAGAAWTVVDEFNEPNGAGSARALGLDRNDNVFVTGESSVGDTGYHWFVRRSVDQGTTWTVRDDQPGNEGSSSTAVATNAAGDVFAGGWIWDNGTYYRCLVRRQLAGSTGWTTVDDYQTVLGGHCWVRGVVVAKGIVFVSMNALDAAGKGHWLIRRSSNNGATWTTVDDLLLDGFCNPRGMAWDRKLELLVTGKCLVGADYKWVTRRTRDLGATWLTEDVFQHPNGYTTYASGIDSSGPDDVYAVGMASDGTKNHWIVRRRICGPHNGGTATPLRALQVQRPTWLKQP